MKISVIIPVFNAEKYIKQCIENILCQTYKNLEIIIINDGSTDKTAEIAQNFPVQLINHPNRGVSAARNAGLDCVTGDYLHFMDVDDLIVLDFYEKMLSAVVATNADMACCELIHERLPDLSLRFNDKLALSNIEDKIQLTNVLNQGGCVKYLFRTNFLKTNNLRFLEEFHFAEDLIFSFQAVYFANKIVVVPRAIYYYKNRPQSAMTSMIKVDRQNRRESKIQAEHLCEKFAQIHGFSAIKNPIYQSFRYKIMGLPVLKKRIYNTGKIHWYILGIRFFQRKTDK